MPYTVASPRTGPLQNPADMYSTRAIVVDEGPGTVPRLDVYQGADRVLSVPLSIGRAVRLAGDLVAVVGRRAPG